MRSKWALPATTFAAILVASTASAQTISYINFLQFDLQSFRSQATAGIFLDDVDMVSDAANLTTIEGNRLFTNFSNLSDPATLGDNVVTYSLDFIGTPTTSDQFDTGSYLVGWIGKYSQDSDYNFSVFYQRNHTKSMVEDLDDLNIGFVGDFNFDAEYSGFTRTTTHDPATGRLTGDTLTNFDLERFDDRSAMNLDVGAARDVSEELSIGGRFFWESDQLDSFAEGTVETQFRTADTLGVFTTTGRTVSSWVGNGEEAYKNRELGVSLDADYHPWENQDVNIRVDVFGTTLVNPSSSLFLPSRGDGPSELESIGTRIDLRENTTFTRIAAGVVGTPGTSPLSADRENSVFSTSTYNPYPGFFGRGGAVAISSVDDDRSGIGFAAKGQWDREWAGGENRAWLGFSHRGADVDATIIAEQRTGNTFFWNDGTADHEATNTILDETVTSTRSGDTSINAFEVGTRWSRPMNQHVSVGLGAIVTRQTSSDEYRQITEDRSVIAKFDDGAAGNNALFALTSDPAHNEEETVIVDTSTADINDELRATTLRLPVGAQFHFKERWTVNIGAQHTIVNGERETQATAPLGGNGPVVTTYTDIGGAGTPPVPNPSYAGNGFDGDAQITDKAGFNTTTYWYGLSVMITDAAQLDINGFFDTHSSDNTEESSGPDFNDSGQIFDVDFFRNLAVSLKYIFW
jgi:hypothetical protein